MLSPLVVAFFSLTVILAVAAISMFRYKKTLNPLEQERLSKGPFPWWYYVFTNLGILIAFLGIRYDDSIFLLAGYVLTFIVVGIAWRKKINQK